MKKSILVKLVVLLVFVFLIVITYSFFCNRKEQTKLICKRATILHAEICNQIDELEYCSGAGYSNGEKVEFGNLGTKGTLNSGDAFDCDVNGDGIYDSKTERFYYVTDLESNNDYAVLIYYNDVVKGNINNNSAIQYDYSNLNNNGPIIAITNLPTTKQWKNVSLFKTIRNITNQNGENTTKSGILPNEFSYEGYSARLLTIQEVKKACNIDDILTIGELDNCNYLLENTIFANNSIDIYGYWLENAVDVLSDSAFDIYGGFRNINYDNINEKNNAVRPVIEVKKTNIDY